jgi:hypothetical protein
MNHEEAKNTKEEEGRMRRLGDEVERLRLELSYMRNTKAK